jgi:resorcinol 4-hydroxylase (FADH2)
MNASTAPESLQLARAFADAPGRSTPVASAPALADLIGNARALVPLLRERAPQTELDRRVSDEVTARFREAGLFRLMQPARYGGYEYGFSACIDVISELARGCTSSSWGCSLGVIHQWLVATFPAEAQEDVWGRDPHAIVCGSYAPAAKAEPVDGGYRVQGKWLWSSNVDNSQWALLGVMFPPDDEHAAPYAGFLLAPRSDWEIEDNWFVAGQSGTGSKAVVVTTPTFVPAHRKLTFAQASSNRPPGAIVNTNPIYRIPFLSAVPVCLVAPILGTAQGAIEAFVETAASRVTRGAVAGGGNRLCDFFPVQSRVAEAAAALDAARLLIYRDTAEVERLAHAGRAIDVETRIRNRRDHSYATRLAREAVDAIFSLVGGNGLGLEQPIPKHISLNWDAVSSMYGQHVLGLEPKGQY